MPQEYSDPSEILDQVMTPLVVTWLGVDFMSRNPPPSPSWPSHPRPQHHSVRTDALMAQVWCFPTAIAVQVPPPSRPVGSAWVSVLPSPPWP